MPWRSASTSTARCRRRRSATGAGRCCRASTARMDSRAPQRPATGLRPTRGASSSATRSRSSRTGSVAVRARSACRAPAGESRPVRTAGQLPETIGRHPDPRPAARSRLPVTQPLRYRQTSTAGDAYSRRRRAATRRGTHRTTSQLPVRPRRQSAHARVRARAARTASDDAAFIRAVLRCFRNGIVLSTRWRRRCSGDNPVDEFLFDTRRGFCEHYASAFVVLLRAAGIPARVVTGYQGGAMNPRGGYMIVRQSDAHAWAEALIDGRWQRFDPTAAVSPSRIEIGLGGALPAGERVPLLARLDARGSRACSSPGTPSTTTGAATSSASTTSGSARCGATGGSTASRHGRSPRCRPRRCSRGPGCSPAGLLFRRRRQERALVLWERLCRRLARAGLPRHAHEGPLALRAARRAALAAIRHRVRVDRRRLCATLRYGRMSGGAGPRAARTRCWRALRRATADGSACARAAPGGRDRAKRRASALMPAAGTERIHRLAEPADLEVQLHLVGVGVAHLGDLLALGRPAGLPSPGSRCCARRRTGTSRCA